MLNRYYPAVNDPHATWKQFIKAQYSLDEIKKSLIKLNRKKDDEQNLFNKAKDEYISSINYMSTDILDAMYRCSDAICGSLENGFEMLNISIQDLGRSLDFRLSLLHEQQVISNLLLGNIAELLRIPDIQRERQYYVEKGLQFFKNAQLNKELFENALENLQKAEKIEKTDYFTLHHIGMIYLYSPAHLDLIKAEYYFGEAAKFAEVESDPKAIRLVNILTKDLSTDLTAAVSDAKKIQYIAAKSYLQCGIACYIQKKYDDAVRYTEKAFTLAPEINEAAYYACLANAMCDNEQQTIAYLSHLIKRDNHYATVASTDPVLAPKNYVQDFLFKLRLDTIGKAQLIVDRYRNTMIQNSFFETDLNDIQEFLKDANYFQAIDTIEYLKRKLPIDEEKELHNKILSRIPILTTTTNEVNDLKTTIKNSFLASAMQKHLNYISIVEIEELFKTNNNQWEVSTKIDEFITYLSNIIKIILAELDNHRRKYNNEIYEIERKIENENRERKKERRNTAEKIENSSYYIRVIGPILSIFLGFRACSVSIRDYDNGLHDKLLAPFGSFFSTLLIGIAISFLLGWLIEQFAKNYKTIEPKDSEYIDGLNNYKSPKNEYKRICENIISQADKISVGNTINAPQSPPNYIPFKEYKKKYMIIGFYT